LTAFQTLYRLVKSCSIEKKKKKFWTWGSSLLTSRVGYVFLFFDDVIADPTEPI